MHKLKLSWNVFFCILLIDFIATLITSSTKIIDVTGNNPLEIKGYIPPRSVVIPGSYTKKFPSGQYQVPCALIIGKRKESTDKKTSLNDALRTHNVSV